MTPYEQLRTRINELLPDRLKLGFGCEVVDVYGEHWTVLHAEPEKVMLYCKRENDAPRTMWHENTVKHGSILGKHLTIEDVLRALAVGSVKKRYHIYESGDMWDSAAEIEECVFDLTKPLSAPENDAACAAVLKLLSV